MERLHPCPGRQVTLTPATKRDGGEWHVQVVVEYGSSEELRLQRLFFGCRQFLWDGEGSLLEVTLKSYQRSGAKTIYSGHAAPLMSQE